MEIIASYIINDIDKSLSQTVNELPAETFVVIKSIAKDAVIPAPFYDELHFASYE